MKPNKAMYYFKLKHDIQNDSELRLAKLEVESLLGTKVNSLQNMADVLSEPPLRFFLDKPGVRIQDYMTRLTYCGKKQGFFTRHSIIDVTPLLERLAYFREFFVLVEDTADKTQSVIQRIFPSLYEEEVIKNIITDDIVRLYDLQPYMQLFTFRAENNLFLLRFVPIHVFYECSDFVIRLGRDPDNVARMFDQALAHLKGGGIYRPYCPSSTRKYKWIEDFIDDRRAPNNYLTHSFFGLKGRFFPRMIHAVINGLGIKREDVLLDCFCGVGTLPVEASLLGISSIGVDINPFFTLVSKVKIESMFFDLEDLRQKILCLLNYINGRVRNNVLASENQINYRPLTKYIPAQTPKISINLPPRLKRGVQEKNLQVIKEILTSITKVIKETEVQDFCKIPLAYYMKSMLKKYSQRKIFEVYEKQLWKMYFSLYFLHLLQRKVYPIRIAKSHIQKGDVRDLKLQEGSVDAMITSPPYLTAIDYVGNDMFSLYVLNLTNNHLEIDRDTIGSTREIEPQLHLDIKNKSQSFVRLTKKVQDLLKEMVRFREKKASALFKYFVDMQKAFDSMHYVLKKNGYLVLIIGKKQEINLGKKTLVIEVAEIIKELGENSGLKYKNIIDIDLYKTSWGAFHVESLIFFQK